MVLGVPEIKLLIMTAAHGLSAEHLTSEERQRIRELMQRMVEYCNEVEAVDGSGDGGGAGS